MILRKDFNSWLTPVRIFNPYWVFVIASCPVQGVLCVDRTIRRICTYRSIKTLVLTLVLFLFVLSTAAPLFFQFFTMTSTNVSFINVINNHKLIKSPPLSNTRFM